MSRVTPLCEGVGGRDFDEVGGEVLEVVGGHVFDEVGGGVIGEVGGGVIVEVIVDTGGRMGLVVGRGLTIRYTAPHAINTSNSTIMMSIY